MIICVFKDVVRIRYSKINFKVFVVLDKVFVSMGFFFKKLVFCFLIVNCGGSDIVRIFFWGSLEVLFIVYIYFVVDLN